MPTVTNPNYFINTVELKINVHTVSYISQIRGSRSVWSSEGYKGDECVGHSGGIRGP